MKTFFKTYITTAALCLMLGLTNSYLFAAEKIQEFDIPSAKGTVTARWVSDAPSPLIVHVKDIHCNYGIQESIADILEILVARYGIDLISVEAAAGEIDPSVFSVFPDVHVKEKVCENFIKKGVLTGAEKLAICNEAGLDFLLWGVETSDLYRKNLETFRTALVFSRQLTGQVKRLHDTVDSLKEHIYPPQLYDFQNQAAQYHSAAIMFDQWVPYLEEQSQTAGIILDDYPHTARLMESMRLERTNIDYGSLAIERQKLMAELKQHLTTDTFRNLLRVELQFNLGALSANEYYTGLSSYIDEFGLQFPNLQTFSRLTLLKSNIDHTALLAELDNLEVAIKNSLIHGFANQSKAGPRQFEQICVSLESISQFLAVYERLITLALSDAELARYNEARSSYSINAIMARLVDIAGIYGVSLDPALLTPDFITSFEKALDLAEQFYVLANERSEMMVSNLLDKMEHDSVDTAVLVTGGFHSRMIENMLKSHGVSYVTITPSSTHGDTQRYLDLMLSADLSQEAFQSASAEYIGYPVLLNPQLSDSDHFDRLRSDLARSIIEFKGIPVDVYRSQLKDDMSRQLFNTLLVLAGLSLDAQPDVAVAQVVKDASAQAIFNYLMSSDNQALTDELIRTGADPQRLSRDDLILYAQYLLSFLELATQVSPESKGYVAYLVDLLKSTKKPELSIIHSAVYITVYKMMDEDRLTLAEDRLLERNHLMQITEVSLRDLAYRIILDMQRQGSFVLRDAFSAREIRLDTSLVFKGITPFSGTLRFTATVPLDDGTQRSLVIRSVNSSDWHDVYNEILEKLDRKKYNYYLSKQPYQAFAGFHVIEQVAPLSLNQVASRLGNPLATVQLLGKAIAQQYLFGYTSIGEDGLRTIMDGSQVIDIINEPYELGTFVYRESEPDLLLLPFTRYIRILHQQGTSQGLLDQINDIFIDSFFSELTLMQQHYAANIQSFNDVPDGVDTQIWNFVRDRLDSSVTDVGAVREKIGTYISTEARKEAVLEGELKSVASDALNDLVARGSISLDSKVSAESIIIGKRDTESFRRMNLWLGIWFEAVVVTPHGNRSFFIKTIDEALFDKKDGSQFSDNEVTAIAVLKALNRKAYDEYVSNVVEYKWHSFGGLRVSEEIGAYDLSEYDPHDPEIYEIARLYGVALAEALVIGLPDRHLKNLRILVDDMNRPVQVINIDYDNVFSQSTPENDFSQIFPQSSVFFDRLKSAGLDSIAIQQIAIRFVKGIEDGLREMIAYNNYANLLSNTPLELEANNNFINTIRQLELIEEQMPKLLQRIVWIINAHVGLDISSTQTLLKNIVHEVLLDACQQGLLTLPYGFWESNIDIIDHVGNSQVIMDQQNLRCTVLIPSASSGTRLFQIISDDGSHRVDDAVSLFNAVHREQLLHIYSDISLEQFGAIHLYEIPGTIRAANYALSDKNLPAFARVMAAAAAQATVLGLPEYSYDDVMLTIENGQSVAAHVLRLDRSFSDEVNPAIWLKAFQDHVKYMVHLDNARQLEASKVFLGYYWWYMRLAQSMYESQSDVLAKHQPLGNPQSWQKAIKRLDGSETDLKSFFASTVAYLNALFSEDITLDRIQAVVLDEIETVIKNELPRYALRVLQDMSAAGEITLPQGFDVADIIIDSHNIDDDMVVDYALPLVCMIRFTGADRKEVRLALKSQSPDKVNRSHLTLTALDLLDRKAYGCFYSQQALPGYTGTYVLDVVGDINAKDFLLQTEQGEAILPSFATQMGEIMAEAYLFGIPDRNLSNIRVALDNGVPVSLFNIDFDEALDANADLYNIIRIQFLQHAATRGVTTGTLRDAAQNFLEGFYRGVVQIQITYAQYAQKLENHPALTDYPDWGRLLKRMNPQYTQADELLHQALELLNVDLNYRFGFTLPATLADQIISAHQVGKSQRRILIDDTQAAHMAYAILKELEKKGHISIHELFTESELELEMFDVREQVHAGQDVLVMQAAVADNKGVRRSYIIKSDYPNNNTKSAVGALMLFDRLPFDYGYVDLELNGFKGFHVFEEIGTIDAADFQFTSPHWLEFSRLIGGAMAEAYAIGLHDRSYNNIRIDMENDVPVAAYNIDFDSSLNEHFDLDNIRYEICVKCILMPRLAGFDQDQIQAVLAAFFDGFYTTYREMQDRFNTHRYVLTNYPELRDSEEWHALMHRFDPQYRSALNTVLELIMQVNDSSYAQEQGISIDVDNVISQIMPARDKQAHQAAFDQNNLDLQNNLQLAHLAYEVLMDISKTSDLVLPDTLSPEQISIGKRSWHMVDPYTGEHRLWFAVSFPDGVGSQVEYIIRSYDHASNAMIGVEALTAVGREPFGYYISSLNRYGFKGFDLIESVGHINASEFDLRSESRDSFAILLGKATATAYVFSICDRHLDNIRITLERGLPVDAINIDLDTALTSSQQWSFEFTDLLRTELLARAKKLHLSNDKIRSMMVEYFKGFVYELSDLHHYYTQHTDELVNHSVLSKQPEWKHVLNRLNPAKMPVLLFINRLIPELNQTLFERSFGFTIEPDEVLPQLAYLPSAHLKPDNTVQLRNIAHRVLLDLAEKEHLPVVPQLATGDIVILNHNYHSKEDAIAGKPMWLEMTVPMADGTKKSFHIKSHTSDNHSKNAIAALQALNRQRYAYYYSEEYLYNISGFHVFEMIGDRDVKDYVPSSTDAVEYAFLIGKAMAEAYTIALPDRNPHNLRVLLKDGKPDQILNIDLDWALHADPEEFNAFLFDYMRMISSVSSVSLRDIFISYLRGFTNEFVSIQTYYRANIRQLHGNPHLLDVSAWKQCLNRMDSQITSVNSVVLAMITKINRAYLSELHGKLLTLHDVVAGSTLSSTNIELIQSVLQNHALSVMQDLSDRGEINLDPDCTPADVYILNHNVRDVNAQLANTNMFVEVSIPLADGTRETFFIKPLRANMDIQHKTAVLELFDRYVSTFFLSDVPLGSMQQFYVEKKVGDQDIGHYMPSEKYVAEYLYYLGRGVAEAYALGWKNRHPGNMRVVLDGARPVSVVNIGYDSLLAARKNELETTLFGYLRFDFLITVVRDTGVSFDTALTDYFRGFYDEIVDMQSHFLSHKNQIVQSPLVDDTANWNRVFDTLNSAKTPPQSLIASAIELLNNPFYTRLLRHYSPGVGQITLDITDIVDQPVEDTQPAGSVKLQEQLHVLAYRVVRDLESRNLLSVHPGLTRGEVRVEDYDMDSDVSLEQASSIHMRVSFLNRYNQNTSISIISDSSDQSLIGYTVYDALGRFSSDYYQFSNLKLYGKNGFHIVSAEPTVSGDTFSGDSPYKYLIANMFGSIMAEAYVTGTTNVDLHDMQVFLKRGNPVKAVNSNLRVDMQSGINRTMVFEAFRETFMDYTRSDLDAHMLAVSYLDGFVATLREIQHNYRAHKTELDMHPKLSSLPGWDLCLQRMDQDKTLPRDVLDSLVEMFNSDPLYREYGVTLDSEEVAPSVKVQSIFAQQGDPLSEEHVLTQLRHLVHRIALELARKKALYLPDQFDPSDILIEEHNFDNRFVQAHPEYMHLLAVVPLVNDGDMILAIAPALPGRNKTAEAHELLKVLGLSMYAYQSVELNDGTIRNFHVTEEISLWASHELAWNRSNKVDFAEKMARPMAIAYMLGLTDRYPQHIRVAFDSDQYPEYFFNRNYDRAFSYDLPVSSIVRFDFLKQAKLAGVADEDLYHMAEVFIANLKQQMYQLQAIFDEHKDSIRSDPRVLAVPEYEHFLNRLDKTKTSVPHVVFEVIASLNVFLASEGFSFTLNPESLVSVRELSHSPEDDPEGDVLMRDFAVKVLNQMSESGLPVPANGTVDNVEIGQRNMFIGADPDTARGNNLWFETKLHLKGGSVKTYFFKTLDKDSQLDLAIHALKSFNRQTFPVFFTDMEFGKFDSFAVLESIGDIGANRFSFKSPHLDAFARLTGNAMGEAYMFGFSDRHFGNIRLRMEGDYPVEAINVDIDEAFDEFFIPDDIGRHLFTELIAPAKRFGITDAQLRSLLVTFLQGLYTSADEIQKMYSENQELYNKLDKLVASAEWQEMLLRIDPKRTSLRELISDIVEWLNLNDVTRKYNFGFTVDEIIGPDELSGEISEAQHVVSNTIEELAYNILKDLARQGKVDLSPQFTLDDIVITKKDLGNMIQGGVEDRIVFEVNYPDGDGEQTSILIKSIRYGDLEYIGSQALAAMERSVFQCFKTDHLFKYYLGFYVIEHVGEMDVADYVPASFNEAKQTAEYIGEAVAEGYMLGFVDRSAENVRLIYRNGRPAKAVNVDLSDALFPEEAPPAYLLDCLMVFIRNRINENYTPAQVTALIHSFMMGFQGEMAEMQEYYLGNHDELENYPGLFGYSRWEAVLKRLDPEQNDTADIQQKVVDYINEHFAQSIVSIASLKILAIDCAQQLKEEGKLPDNTEISHETVTVSLNNSDSLNVMAGEISLWFVMSVALPDGGKHEFFVKAKMDSDDYSIPVFEALRVLDRYPYTFMTVMQSLGSFSSFVVTDFIGDKDAEAFDVTDQNAFIFAQQLGMAYGEAQALGLRDRLLQNMRVIIDDGKPVRIVNVDFEDGFANYEDTDDFLLPVARLFAGLRADRFTEDELRRMMVGFLNGFAYSIAQLQTFFVSNRESLLNNPLLNANPYWRKVLVHLDGNITPLETPLLEAWDYLRDITKIDAASHLQQLAMRYKAPVSSVLSGRLLNETEVEFETVTIQPSVQTIGEFVASQGFVPYTPEHASYQMDIDINHNGSLFLKRYNTNHEQSYHPGIMRKVIDLSRRAINNVVRVYKEPALLKRVTLRGLLVDFYYRARMLTYFILYGKFSSSGIELVENRLGNLVPPMIRAYYAPDGTVSEIQGEGSSECILQKRMPYVLNELFENYKRTNDSQRANALLDRYFDLSERMWRRGVFDTDLTMWKNYGADNIEASDIRVFDVSGLTDSRLVASYALLVKPFFERIPQLFSEILPEDSFEYFKKRHAEVFTLRNFNSLWKTEQPVAAPRLNFADYSAVDQPAKSSDYEEQRTIIRTFLAPYDLAGRKDVEEAMLSLFSICNQENSIDDIAQILGRPITAESLRTTFAVRDSKLMREITSMVFALTSNVTDYFSIGLLQLAFYEYMSIVLEKDVNPVDLSVHPRRFFAYEHSI